jgi:hypothetical protein
MLDTLFRAARRGAAILYNSDTGAFSLVGPLRINGKNVSPTRFELDWVAGRRGKPGINADIQNAAEATRMVTDNDFEILGTNGDSSCVAFGVEGGIVLTTKTTANDQVILLPHLDANQTAWTQTTWGTDKETIWECDIATGAAITSSIIWAGLKLTNTPTAATDNDQVFLRYEAGVSSGSWVLWYSIGGTDVSVVLGAVAVSTRYHIKVVIDSARIAKVYLNGVLAGTTTALTDATDLIPYIGVQTTTTAARVLTVYHQGIGRIAG